MILYVQHLSPFIFDLSKKKKKKNIFLLSLHTKYFSFFIFLVLHYNLPLICLSVLKAPGMNVLKVSLSRPRERADGVSVWEWSGSALDEGDEASQWFSNYLGKPCRLVRFNSGRA
jgi:hypothetical protein